jgi:hypothetical protein
MMNEAQRQLHDELNAPTSDLEERLAATRRVLDWLEQATFKQAETEACTLHHDVNLILAKPLA